MSDSFFQAGDPNKEFTNTIELTQDTSGIQTYFYLRSIFLDKTLPFKDNELGHKLTLENGKLIFSIRYSKNKDSKYDYSKPNCELITRLVLANYIYPLRGIKISLRVDSIYNEVRKYYLDYDLPIYRPIQQPTDQNSPITKRLQESTPLELLNELNNQTGIVPIHANKTDFISNYQKILDEVKLYHTRLSLDDYDKLQNPAKRMQVLSKIRQDMHLKDIEKLNIWLDLTKAYNLPGLFLEVANAIPQNGENLYMCESKPIMNKIGIENRNDYFIPLLKSGDIQTLFVALTYLSKNDENDKTVNKYLDALKGKYPTDVSYVSAKIIVERWLRNNMEFEKKEIGKVKEYLDIDVEKNPPLIVMQRDIDNLKNWVNRMSRE